MQCAAVHDTIAPSPSRNAGYIKSVVIYTYTKVVPDYLVTLSFVSLHLVVEGMSLSRHP
jgi:hypothetical protein